MAGTHVGDMQRFPPRLLRSCTSILHLPCITLTLFSMHFGPMLMPNINP